MNNIFSTKLKSDMNNLIWVYTQYLPVFFWRAFLVVLLLAAGLKVASSGTQQMPVSEVNYPGASSTKPFTAMEPYVVNIQGVDTTIPLRGASRTHDFSGNIPFVNPNTNFPDPDSMQAWDQDFAESFSPPLEGDYDLYGKNLTNAGFPGRVEKKTINGVATTMVRYNAGDGTTWGTPRSKLNAFPIPPRTSVRWELEVAFGNADGVNDWTLTPTTKWIKNNSGKWVMTQGSCPVLFWQIKSDNMENPPLLADVDTDDQDPNKLKIVFGQRAGSASKVTYIATVHGLPRHTFIPIVVEAFLDERESSNGGKGLLKIWVNNKLVLEKAGPTLARGPKKTWWSIDSYLWGNETPSAHTRAIFFKTAKMMVFPTEKESSPPQESSPPPADTTAPSDPQDPKATFSEPSKVTISWSASTDNVGVAGYRIYRDDIEIGTSNVTNFTDTSIAKGTSYNYTIEAYDAAGNHSDSSNMVIVEIPQTMINISSYYVKKRTTHSAIVKWTTNLPSTGIVYYGTSPNKMESSATFNKLAKSHSVQITGLDRKSKYYYKITAKDSDDLTTSSSIASFRTRKKCGKRCQTWLADVR